MRPTIYKQHKLSNEDINRYSRQLLIPEIGVDGQTKLLESKVLIVGAGGLGCPSAIYLAAAGINTIGIVDHDVISIDNLHRQILHAESDVGKPKTGSIRNAVNKLNANIIVIEHRVLLDAENILPIMRVYDIVIDCSDNAPTKYLVNDACVYLSKPLVWGAALKWEGQFTVYNAEPTAPCYRCIHPKPPPPEAMTNCSEGGVLGPVVGIIGCQQAMETLKLLAGIKSSYSGHLFLYNALEGQTRKIRLRDRVPTCAVCGDGRPTKWPHTNYTQFCRVAPCDKTQCISLLSAAERLSVEQLSDRLRSLTDDVKIVDSRPPCEFEIARLPGAINLPLDVVMRAKTSADIDCMAKFNLSSSKEIICICHRGNDSQRLVLELRRLMKDNNKCVISDVIGGYEKYSQLIDADFPTY